MLDIKIVMTPFSIFAEVSIIFTHKNMGQHPTKGVILGGIQKLRRQKGFKVKLISNSMSSSRSVDPYVHPGAVIISK